MKHKKYIVALVLIQAVFLLNCKKEPVRNNTAPQAMYDLLSRDTLEFESYILKWNTSSVDTMYTRDSGRNKLLDTAWFKFDKNGKYQAYLSDNFTYSASWEFLDNGSKLRLWNDQRKFDQEFTLLKLTQDTVELLNPKLDNLFYRLLFK
ncbi:MAG TPA: hypothetical protein VL095_00555 [Flavisolibacter sp.]|nr:hypothetical protein [Flavisolibacter sp.]